MGDRRTLTERIIVAILSVTIAVIFVVATKPWQARLPHNRKPTHTSSSTR